MHVLFFKILFYFIENLSRAHHVTLFFLSLIVNKIKIDDQFGQFLNLKDK